MPRSPLTLLLFALAVAAGCPRSTTPEEEGGKAGVGGPCSVDDECEAGLVCRAGACGVRVTFPDAGRNDAGGGGSDAGRVDAGASTGDAGHDAGPGPRLVITPSPLVDFGAQRPGVPVTHTVLASNTGSAPLTIYAIFVSNNPSGEFTASPSGTQDVTLNPGDEINVQVTHTPVDGTPDTAELQFVHSGRADGPDSVTLQATFKGTPAISITTAAPVLSPSVAMVSMGSVPLAQVATARLFVRNTGAGNSALTVRSAIITPDTAGFTITSMLPADTLLASFDAQCSSPASCPSSHAACTNMVCVDGDGVTPDTLVVDVAFTPGNAGAHAAILTLVHSDGVTDAQANVDLDAVGARGVLMVTPGMVNVGGVIVGRPVERAVTLSNTGDAPLTVDAPGLVGDAAISVVAPGPITLSPSGNAEVTIRVNAVAEGPLAATLQLRGANIDAVDVPIAATARLAPSILVSPTLAFGGVYAGQSSARDVSIRNGGPGRLNVTSVSVTGPAAARFSVTPTSFPNPLDPLASLTDTSPALDVTVAYLPAATPTGIEDTATLVLLSDDPDQPRAEVALTGLAVKPQIVVQPISLDFGSVRASSTPSTRTLQVFNNGFGPLTITQLQLGGGSPFAVESAPALPFTVALASPVTITLRFLPSQVGTATDTLVIRSDDALNPVVNVGLNGVGTTPSYSPVPAGLDFGTVFIGRSTMRTFSVQNTGSGSGTITGASVVGSGGYAIISPVFPVTLAASASATITVSFAPGSEGLLPAVATLATDSGADVAVPLTGAGRLEPTVLVPNGVDLGNVYAGSAANRAVAIRNSGPGQLNITGISITGSGAARFAASPTSFAAPLAPLAAPTDTDPHVDVTVTYQPLDPPSGAADVASLVVTTDDPDSPMVEIPLTGQSIKPVIEVAPATLAFGTVVVGTTTAAQQVTVRNTGFGPLVVTATSLPMGSAFSVTVAGAPLPRTLPSAAESLVLDVRFTPSSATTFTGALTVASTDLALPVATVALAGAGRPCDARPGASFVQTGAQCTYSCNTNRWDLDGDLNASTSNGCEYTCTRTSTTDTPDDSFTDANCDGIDGDPAVSIFVASNGDNANPGTMAEPKATVTAGISAASAAGKTQVLVSEGVYTGRVTLANGVSVHGAYSRNNGWARSTSYVTTLRSTTVASGRKVTMEGLGISATTTVAFLAIDTTSTTSTGVSVYGIYCNSCTGLRLRHNFITAGDAGAGGAGSPGSAGADGTGGGAGGAGDCDDQDRPGAGGTAGANLSCNRPGGAGGRGGKDPDFKGLAGANGAGGTVGGAGGAGGDPGRAGTNGAAGAPGGPGMDGAGGAGGGVTAGFWAGGLGGSGLGGGDGEGGAGGGGGGGQSGTWVVDGAGNGGGGGGGGGCGGTRGTGGSAGGGSFGVMLVASTGVVLVANTITSGNGGNGGAGGAGGNGGSGGSGNTGGNNCTDEIGRGGTGGNGGAGGRGGHGGGGEGGPSFAVYRSGTSLTLPGSNTLANGTGGTGGFSVGNDGATGASGLVY